ncbi:cytochrome b-245 chaperone 1-like [Anneissia japonica]|uniref:cytochrome b-245 chaperone 1-like n=1 Tax=Anneissia japonica TaxID=1529436 RepID=UPI0014257926|nr:cytochrome b-245 chaperone 1-like [Anneissia japonica]XP_033100550.1 cytochrome b-245 chaperone 1-like [Anneissia japonica]XP_033100557.1 cytochrome b-245 chaperone 1-like [Anneissia japonica]
MVYMSVVSETENELHLKRTPGARSWSILIGFISVGIGAWTYTQDTLPWKLLYISFCIMIGVTSIDDWEDCIIDKKIGEVRTSRFGLIRMLFSGLLPPSFVVTDIVEVIYADVEEDVTKLGKGCYVVLRMASGIALPLTDTCTLGSDTRQHHEIANKINSFLNLKKMHREPSLLEEMEESDSSSDSGSEGHKDG